MYNFTVDATVRPKINPILVMFVVGGPKNVTEFICGQLKKALSPREYKYAPNINAPDRLEHPLNALANMFCTLSRFNLPAMLVHPRNAPSMMVVTAVGKTTDVNPVHPLKQFDAIVLYCATFGSNNDVNPTQFLNASSLIC
jgi:hypothetical protein